MIFENVIAEFNEEDADAQVDELHDKGNLEIAILFQSLNEKQKIYFNSMAEYINTHEDPCEVVAPLLLLLKHVELSIKLERMIVTIH